MYSQRVESIRSEPISFQQLIISMLNRLDLQIPTTMKENYREWVGVQSKLFLMDALLAPHCSFNYEKQRAGFKQAFKTMAKTTARWHPDEYLSLVSDWIYALSAELPTFDLLPAKKKVFDYEEITEAMLSEEFLKHEKLDEKELDKLEEEKKKKAQDLLERQEIRRILEERETKIREEMEHGVNPSNSP